MKDLLIRASLRVRRKLCWATVFCLAGVYLGRLLPGWYGAGLVLCALSVLFWKAFGRYLCFAVFCPMIVLFFLGFTLTGRALSVRDAPTPPGTHLSGRVTRIVYENRVILSDVTVEGERTTVRPAAVTLMLEEDEAPRSVRVGQTIEGTGRLFVQDEPRNPGETDRRIQALADGYDLSGYILPGWTASGEATFSLVERFRQAREAVVGRMRQVFGEDAPLYEAVLLGERKEMDADVVRSMRLTGTAHLLTVSGLHLSLVAFALDALLYGLSGMRGLHAAVKALLLIGFAGLTGGAPGTIRALIMAMIREYAAQRGKSYDALTALAVAALLMTLVNPVRSLSGGFIFSFFVVLGILLLGNAVQGRFAGLSRTAACLRLPGEALSISLCAQLASLPIQLLFYGYVPLLSLPMNLLSGLLAPFLMAVGALCTAVGAVSVDVGRALAGVLCVPGRLFEQASVALANLPFGILRLPAPYAVCVPLAGVAMALVSKQIDWNVRIRRLRPAVIAVMLLLYAPRFCPIPRYVQLDVGQGDAAVIRSGRHAALVDVGPQDSYAALSYLRHEGLTVDCAVLSHLDEDHAGALGSLLTSEVRVGEIVMPQDARDDADSEAVLTALADAALAGVPVREVAKDDAFDAAGVRFNVLSPDETLSGSNERSLLLLTEVQGIRFLLTGDLPDDSEPENPPDCDVLKVAHHGSKNATTRTFLERTTPRVALISVGADNRYGHPAPRVLEDLADLGAQIYRTDLCGCVTLWLWRGREAVQTFIARASPS